MPNYTNNLKLEKPLQSENYNIDIFNSNADKIDTAFQEVKEARTNKKGNTYAKLGDRLNEFDTQLANKLEGGFLDSYMSNNVTYEEVRDTETNTTYIVVTIPKTDSQNNSIKWEVSTPKGWNSSNNILETPRKQCLDNDFTVCINGGLVNANTFKPLGVTIQNGIVKTSEISPNSKNWYIGINKETGMFEAGRLADTTVDNLKSKYDNLLTSFVPLIVDGKVKMDNVLNDCPNGKDKHPRQILCQKADGTVIIITSDGRRQGQEGWTLKEAQTICQKYGVDFAFNLDGGGSAQTVYRGTLLSQPIDVYHSKERTVFSCLGFKVKDRQTEKDDDIKTISKITGEIKAELDYAKHYNVFNRGVIQLKASSIDTNHQGIDVYENNKRINKLQLSKEQLYYFNTETEGDTALIILRVDKDGLVTTGFGSGYIQDSIVTDKGLDSADELYKTGIYWFDSSKLGIEGEASKYAVQHIQSGSVSALQIATPYSSTSSQKPKRRCRNADGVWFEWVDNI